MQVLIVEDNEVLARGMLKALSMLDSGKSLHVVSNLRAAREYLGRGNKVDVALVDLGLPDAAGIEAPTSLRMMDPDMAIIVVSGSETSNLTRELLRNGIEDFVPKSEASAARILSAISSVRHRQQRARRLQNGDLIQVTDGVLNKLGFYVAMRSCIDCANRLGIKCGLLAIELTGLEDAVEAHGQATGEIALRQACNRISHIVRHGDTLGFGENDLLYVLLNAVSGIDDVRLVAEKIRERFDTPLHVNVAIPLSATIGGALFPAQNSTVREWLDRTHEALNQARSKGGVRSVIYRPSPAATASSPA